MQQSFKFMDDQLKKSELGNQVTNQQHHFASNYILNSNSIDKDKVEILSRMKDKIESKVHGKETANKLVKQSL